MNRKEKLRLASAWVGYLGVIACLVAAIVYIILAKNATFGITFNKNLLLIDACVAVAFIIVAAVLKVLGSRRTVKAEEPSELPVEEISAPEEQAEEPMTAEITEEIPEETPVEESQVVVEQLPEMERPTEKEILKEIRVNEQPPIKPAIEEKIKEEKASKTDLRKVFQSKAKDILPEKAYNIMSKSADKIKDALPAIAATVVTVITVRISQKIKKDKQNAENRKKIFEFLK